MVSKGRTGPRRRESARAGASPPGVPEAQADEAAVEHRSTTIGRRWVIVIGLSALAVSAFTIVLVPVVAALVAGWWLATDARATGSRAPGALGKVALLLLALVWSVTAWAVVGFDAHFDCGGTLGGFGESASARRDDDCYDRRILMVVPAMVLIVCFGAATAGAWVRRWAGGPESDTDGSGRRSPGVVSSIAVGGCVLVWSSVMTVIVAL